MATTSSIDSQTSEEKHCQLNAFGHAYVVKAEKWVKCKGGLHPYAEEEK